MSRKPTFTDTGWTDYLSWQQDRPTLKKLNRLIDDISRSRSKHLCSESLPG
ncbi:type II toxin-antitoxin system YoeB family toxin [Nocardia terpenica]|uniref:Endoribonuclease YoeB n=1 Tax=Nocardia terpenica TaxID=455432 RepID=A0A6G9Z1N8_9NOCA|nr:hypothetical protein F6W96_14265 [Nocardia terpenica]